MFLQRKLLNYEGFPKLLITYLSSHANMGFMEAEWGRDGAVVSTGIGYSTSATQMRIKRC